MFLLKGSRLPSMENQKASTVWLNVMSWIKTLMNYDCSALVWASASRFGLIPNFPSVQVRPRLIKEKACVGYERICFMLIILILYISLMESILVKQHQHFSKYRIAPDVPGMDVIWWSFEMPRRCQKPRKVKRATTEMKFCEIRTPYSLVIFYKISFKL